MLNVCHSQVVARCALSISLALVPALSFTSTALYAQAPAPAPTAAARQSGTVKAIDSSSITVVTAAGAQVSVPVTPDATVLQLAPGSTSLSAAQPAKFADIAVGDKVIVGKPGDTTSASRIILMKSSDIAARNQAEQADWQKRGTAGLVKSVDGPTLTVSSGTRTEKIETTSKTIFRRYAADSVKFQDSVAGTLSQIHSGDQLSVRGDKSVDGLTITAEEVVTGTFANLSGVLTGVDAKAGTVSFKDLTTKKPVTVKLTANSDLRNLPPMAAAMFTQRGAPAATGVAGADRPASGAERGGMPSGGGPGGSGGTGGSGGAGAPSGTGAGAGRPRTGMDLSRMLARLPTVSVADLKNGDAVMIVASPGADSFTAITLLSGVEALLTAPAGQAPITLSPWNMSTPEAGGGPQ